MAESIPATGLIEEENEDFLKLSHDYEMPLLTRLSFWGKEFQKQDEVKSLDSRDLVGYAIIKYDWSPGLKIDQHHVFEAVFRKYYHPHNCVPLPKTYRLNVLGRSFLIEGVLYAQQNGATKACAQVALRSLLSRHLKVPDVSYRHLNALAEKASPREFHPANGLSTHQIRFIFDELGVSYRDINYKESPKLREEIPYQKYLYAGIESGAGALLGFQLNSVHGPRDEYHIIPFYGHTFNKDTWAPDADIAYFNIGGSLGYIPSISWTSSFLGHDDNFGPNFCINRLYVQPKQVAYAVELLHEGYLSGGSEAEAVSIRFLMAIRKYLDAAPNIWAQRLNLKLHHEPPQVVLRSLAIPKERYIKHLREARDWESNQEDATLCNILAEMLPPSLWIVEVSIPHLFPANERKLGEIILNGEKKLSADSFEAFMLARMPGFYYFKTNETVHHQRFLEVASKLKSHIDLIHS
ncbi:MAG: hypothetical protein JJU29_07915 [Verrucomicrobia bacterium]|nr:hypothetical protein [Verrucomicrobiota bacterium]MCH8511949.1 hypothetical protein [Kiritimatiellia bacterium]